MKRRTDVRTVHRTEAGIYSDRGLTLDMLRQLVEETGDWPAGTPVSVSHRHINVERETQ